MAILRPTFWRLTETLGKRLVGRSWRSLESVMRDYRSYHKRVVGLIESLPDADLVTLQRFSWTGPSWTLSDYLRASTAAHYLWARTRIRRWWRAQETGKRAAAK